MIMILEIAMTIFGIYMLFTGKTWSKEVPPHGQFRLLGAFFASVLPVAFVAAMIVGIVLAAGSASSDPETVANELTWPLIGVEVATVVFYAVVGSLWEKSIRRKAMTPPGAAFEQPSEMRRAA
ncbi:hypothetical protein PHYC_01627 [Phycisphaerales bacterium]|nr:hypothetical protein PHYC_01627 [Phycisphaerales bacterium]